MRPKSMDESRISTKNFLTLFSKNFLISHYTHLGYKKRYTHFAFRKALLGSYNSICIINPIITLTNLKICSKFLYSILLDKTKKICFVVQDISKRLFLKDLCKYDNHYLVNSWPAGLLTNDDVLANSKKLRRRRCHYPETSSIFLTVNIESSRLFSIISEVRSREIPIINFVDSLVNLGGLTYWVPINLKSAHSHLFILHFFQSLLAKIQTQRKISFFKTVLKQFHRANELISYPERIFSEKTFFRRMRHIHPKERKYLNPKYLRRKYFQPADPPLKKKIKKTKMLKNLAAFKKKKTEIKKQKRK